MIILVKRTISENCFLIVLPLLTSDLYHAILGLDHQLFRGEVVDVQSDLPGLLGLLDLRHARAELLGHHGGLDHHWGQVVAEGGAHVSGHTEGLVEESVALVPVPEGVPARGAEQAEGDASLCHVCWKKRSSTVAVVEL
uniref:Uncharacterized protein n=1 Tax=Hucho hucho TaxID=62062 RepID=A0A4W5PRR3_9TELE